MVLQAGESLWVLAERHLGDGDRWPELAELNGLSDPSTVAVGQTIRLPAPSGAANPSIPGAVATESTAGPASSGAVDRHPWDAARLADQTALGTHLPLSRGARGDGVRLLQGRLNVLGADMVADGVFGRQTQAAVRMFQAANGLDANGTVDSTTARTLYSSSAHPVQEARLDGVPGRYLGTYDAWRRGEHLGEMDVVELDGVKVAAHTARAWETLKAAAAADGVHLKLNSGFRTMDEQAALRERFLDGRGPVAAVPGYSNHQHGQALDIDMMDRDAKAWMFEHGPQMGWRNTVPSESWHWEYFGP